MEEEQEQGRFANRAAHLTAEGLTLTGKDSALSKLLLSVIGAFAEFERSLILERQREGIAITKAAGKYRGGKAKRTAETPVR